MKEKLIDHLRQFVTEKRLALFEQKLALRTRYLTIILEDIFQPHNASAVLRSCECFGIQDVHIIENRNEYRINPEITLGSNKWLSLYRYNEQPDNTLAALDRLKQQGYRIVATTPHRNDCLLDEFDMTRGKFALLFGSELDGISPAALDAADEFLRIPMAGFTESLNISVSAAVCIHHLTSKLRQSSIEWRLSAAEQQSILLQWLRNTIRKSDLIERSFENNSEIQE
jgi:tRNA (guanosine-2'-O-)-methyltransferase